jgi:hypothetical protein
MRSPRPLNVALEADKWPQRRGHGGQASHSLIRGEGDITLGRVGPIACAATAADGSNMLVALVRRRRESFEQLLDRLDAALQKSWDDDVYTDEING